MNQLVTCGSLPSIIVPALALDPVMSSSPSHFASTTSPAIPIQYTLHQLSFDEATNMDIYVKLTTEHLD